MPSIEGIEARRAALQILDAVLRRGETLDAAAAKVRNLAANDQGLAVAIAGEAIRRLPDLDELIDTTTRMRLPDDSKARAVLRLALAQSIGLKTPPHAVVSTALPLVEGGPRRLVHGILGTLFRQDLPTLDPPRLPAKVDERWRASWGEAAVLAARRQIATRPQLDLTFAEAGTARAYAQEHAAVSLAPNHVRLKSSSVSELPGFTSGQWWVQDLAASLPARLIPARTRQVIDLCAAPGGKTMQLAAAGHSVVAVDSSASRLRRLGENMERTRLGAELVEADALRWAPRAAVDAILLDAPCSATGTFRRHPEVLYRARPDVIAFNAIQQARLLDRSCEWLTPGGVLVYSVCSLERDEGEHIIEQFLERRRDFTLEPPSELPQYVRAASEGWVRILPGLLEEQGGLDGFFIARLVRVG